MFLSAMGISTPITRTVELPLEADRLLVGMAGRVEFLAEFRQFRDRAAKKRGDPAHGIPGSLRNCGCKERGEEPGYSKGFTGTRPTPARQGFPVRLKESAGTLSLGL